MNRLTTAALAGALVLASGINAPAKPDGYDWLRPGEKETEAALSASVRGNRDLMADLLDDGLGVDQRIPLHGARIPLLSLAVIADAVSTVKLLIAEGAEIDLMSTGVMEDKEALEDYLLTFSR